MGKIPRETSRRSAPSAAMLRAWSVSTLFALFAWFDFSSRTRLVAHLAETRARGKRLLTCGAVVRAGLVAQISPEEIAAASRQDRLARSDSRKRGHTQPPAIWPAKRLCSGGTLAVAAAQAQKRLRDSCADLVPRNAVDWQALKPTKRIRGKTNLDSLILRSGLALPVAERCAPS